MENNRNGAQQQQINLQLDVSSQLGSASNDKIELEGASDAVRKLLAPEYQRMIYLFRYELEWARSLKNYDKVMKVYSAKIALVPDEVIRSIMISTINEIIDKWIKVVDEEKRGLKLRYDALRAMALKGFEANVNDAVNVRVVLDSILDRGNVPPREPESDGGSNA